jgi:hypothetical protein
MERGDNQLCESLFLGRDGVLSGCKMLDIRPKITNPLQFGMDISYKITLLFLVQPLRKPWSFKLFEQLLPGSTRCC